MIIFFIQQPIAQFNPFFHQFQGSRQYLAAMTENQNEEERDDDMDVSLATLFKLSKTTRKGTCGSGKATNKAKSNSPKDSDEQVDKLILLLNNYCNWEVRRLLILILKSCRAAVLKDRLLGKEHGTVSTEESDYPAEDAGDPSAPPPPIEQVQIATIEAKTYDLEQTAVGGVATFPVDCRHTLRRSRSRESLSATSEVDQLRGSDHRKSLSRAHGRGRRPRSLSADRKLGGACEVTMRCSKNACRHTLRRSRSRESLYATSEVDQLRGSDHRKSLSRAHGRGRRPRSLSADRKLGGACEGTMRCSKNAASSRQAVILAKRRELDNVKHTDSDATNGKRVLRKSKASTAPMRDQSITSETSGSSSVRRSRAGPTKNLSTLQRHTLHGIPRRQVPARNAKNATSNEGFGVSVHSVDRVVSSSFGMRDNVESKVVSDGGNNKSWTNINTVDTFHYSSQGESHPLITVPNQKERTGNPGSAVKKDRFASKEDDGGFNQFLQFQPRKGKEQVKASSCGFAVDALVEELKDKRKASSHFPVESCGVDEAESNATRPASGREKLLQRGLSFVRRIKKSSEEKNKIPSNEFDAESSESDSDIGSFS